MSHRVIISLGSDTRQEHNIARATAALSALLRGAGSGPAAPAGARFSRLLWTEDVSGSGHRYLNRLAAGYTTLTAEQLGRRLKEIEAAQGRLPGAVTIDLDLLLYDDCRHHLSDWPRPYIQQLINDIL